MDLRLDGKRALVCGASRGIGKAAAVALSRLGARVTLLARNPEALASAVDDLAGEGHSTLAADLADSSGVDAIVASVTGDGPVHILVNNSGGPAGGPLFAADPGQLVQALEQHLLAAHRLVQGLVPGMRQAGYGRIVNIISTSVKEPIPGLGVSNTTRGAVASWSKTLAGELGVHGITVNNVLPGFTATERLASLFTAQAERAGRSLEDVENAALKTVPLGRFGRPEEVGGVVAFLASPAAAYVNGVSLAVDGGRTRSI